MNTVYILREKTGLIITCMCGSYKQAEQIKVALERKRKKEIMIV